MIRPAAAAIAFLTRLPVSPHSLTPAELGRSIIFFPLAGLLLGAIAAATAATAAALALDATLTAIALVALGAYLTGGLHLDGVADLADGLGGGRGDRARTLAIMKDSRIGAFGAIALVLLLLAKVHAATLVVVAGTTAGTGDAAGMTAGLWPLVAAPVVARALAATLIVAFPYARPDGLGRVFHDRGRWYHAALALALAVAIASLVDHALVAAATATTVTLALAAWLHRRLGGLTGDAYGAAIEAAELTFLVVASATL